MSVYNTRFELTEAKKRYLLMKFAEQHEKHNQKNPHYVFKDIENMENNHQIPLKTPLNKKDNQFFIKEQKARFGSSPAIAIDWVASFVSHMKNVTGLDYPRVLQVHADNIFLSGALMQCSIDTIAYQQNKRVLFKPVGELSYKKAESAIRQHHDSIDVVLIVTPFVHKEYLQSVEKYKHLLKGKYIFVLCANKSLFSGLAVSEVLGQVHKKNIEVNGEKTPLIHSSEHKDEFYDLVCFSKMIEG